MFPYGLMDYFSKMEHVGFGDIQVREAKQCNTGKTEEILMQDSINDKGKQIKSKTRVSDHGEVFTNEREVNAMLDLVSNMTDQIESKFLEPACGNGNFLAEVLNRKLSKVTRLYKKSQFEWERNAVIAVSSLYGVDILDDNAQECRDRLLGIFIDWYSNTFKQIKNDCIRSVRFILGRNILWGNALDFINPETGRPIIFSEWSPVNGAMIKRKDYMFKFLVEQSFQFSMFNDEGNTGTIDEPVKEFPLIHFLKIGEDDSNELQS